jgi:hypothetical protein
MAWFEGQLHRYASKDLWKERSLNPNSRSHNLLSQLHSTFNLDECWYYTRIELM